MDALGMKKLLALAAILIAYLAGCSDGKDEATGSASDGTARPLVYATNYPLKYFVERIAAPVVDVRFLVPGDEDTAYWRPDPEDVLAMQKAGLIVLNGASYEAWLKNVSLPPSRMVVTADGLSDQLIPLEEEASHSHGLEGDHEHSGTAFTTWLDPTLAAAQAGAIKDALSERWPQHSSQFEAQFAGLTQELTALDTEAQEAVAGNQELPVLFSHPVYQYLVHRYGLNARSVHWEPDQMPDEAEWQELLATLGDFPASWMIWEGTPLPQIRERLESIGIRSVVFDPCANTPPSGDFLSTMEKNLQALRLVFTADGRSGSRRVTR
jgi:zinc transport system substrate-binding protein